MKSINKTQNWNFKNKACSICNKEFKPTNGKEGTCSKECSNKVAEKNKLNYIKAHPDRLSKASNEWNKRNRERLNAYQREYVKTIPEKVKARSDSKWLVKRKRIGECLDCEKICKREIHHIKYTPTDFVLICKDCHLKRHGRESRV